MQFDVLFENVGSFFKKLSWWIVILLIVCVIALPFWRWGWVTLIEKHEFAFVFNKVGGAVNIINHTGYYIANPITKRVHTIDLRPHQIQINNNGTSTMSAHADVNSRVLNAKLVRFNPAGLDTFIAWHGMDAGDDVDKLLSILKIYAFDPDGGKDCPFLIVEKSLASTGVHDASAAQEKK